MAKPSDDHFTYSFVFVAKRDRIYLLAEADDHSGWAQFNWKGQLTGQNILPFAPVFVHVIPDIQVDVVGVEGEWKTAIAGRPTPITTGNIDPGPTGPGTKGWIRGCRLIDGRLYAVGMSRQAYVRDENYVWQHIDANLLGKRGEIVGLNAIDGFSSKEVYAAGLGGEIWRWNGVQWSPVPSPTNIQLMDVRCIGEHVYIVGLSGLVLRGRMGNFQVLTTVSDEPSIEVVEPFNDTIYAASLRKIYRLQGGTFREVDTNLGDITAGSLSSADGVLWSVGAKHVLWTDDGKKWNQVFL